MLKKNVYIYWETCVGMFDYVNHGFLMKQIREGKLSLPELEESY